MRAVFIHRMGPQAASFRYRAAIPAQEIGASVNGGEGQVYIFSKPTFDDLALAKECKAEGVKVVADFCDDHFNHATWGPVYVEMAKLCDALVVNTENMAGRIMKYIGRKADTVIADPYEEALTAPHANGSERYLWFGSPINLKDLDQYWSYIKHLNVTFVTGHNPRKDFDYLHWTPQVQTEQLHKANVVLMPTRKGVEYKSANRIVNALMAGCFVVGAEHPSQHEFRRYVWTGNMMTGIKWARHFKDELDEMVLDGQVYCTKFSPANIGAQWKQLIDSLCEST